MYINSHPSNTTQLASSLNIDRSTIMACRDYKQQTSLFSQSLLPLLAVLALLGGTNGAVKPTVDQEPKIVTAAPTTVSNVVVSQRPPPSTDREQCVPFHHYYCSKFGYNSTISPNPWARDLTLEEAASEFEDFVSLLRQNCSEKLGTFLCFTYFPLCYQQPDVGKQLVLPCRETCDIVHSSECNDIVQSSVGGWAGHLQCSKFHTKSESENGNCADGDQQVWAAKPTESDNIETTTTPSSPPTTTEQVKPPVTTGDKNTTISCGGDDKPKCKSACSVREKCSGGTLKANDYKFVAKVVISHKLADGSHCKHAYQVDVVQQYNLSSWQDGNKQLAYAPAMQSHTIIHTSPLHCDACPMLADGTTYLLAGQYYTSEDGTTVWELPNSRSKSIVSEWTGKSGRNYNKKLEGWIADANRERLLQSKTQ